MRKISLLIAVITSFQILRGVLVGIFMLVSIGVIWEGLAWSGWVIECVDCQTGGFNGAWTDVSMAVDSDGKVHIAYYHGGIIKYATNRGVTPGTGNCTHKNWNCESLGTGGDPSIAIDSNNNVHASGGFKYATNKNGFWEIDTTAPFGGDLAIDSNNKVHIKGAGSYASNASGSWVVTSLPYGGYSMALDANNNLYINDGEGYATNESGSWVYIPIPECLSFASNDSIVVDPNNKVHLTCTDDVTIYATNESGSLVTTIVNDAGCAWPSIAVDSNNKIHISRGWSVTDNYINYITNASGSWISTSIEEQGEQWDPDSRDSSIAVDSNNNVHISYKAWEG